MNAQVIEEEVRVAVECPVCLMVPRQVPIPMCPAGHVVCRRCRRHVKGKCPTCRRKLRRGDDNSVAASLFDKIPHTSKHNSCQERDILYWSTQHHAGFDIKVGDTLGETAAVVPGPGAGEVSGHLNEALVDGEKTHRGHHHPAKAGRSCGQDHHRAKTGQRRPIKCSLTPSKIQTRLEKN